MQLKKCITIHVTPTTPQTGSEIHREPRLQTHTIRMEEISFEIVSAISDRLKTVIMLELLPHFLHLSKYTSKWYLDKI